MCVRVREKGKAGKEESGAHIARTFTQFASKGNAGPSVSPAACLLEGSFDPSVSQEIHPSNKIYKLPTVQESYKPVYNL